jgi:Cadherin-like beta sandwich domain/Domain of unknown function (DUF4073)
MKKIFTIFIVLLVMFQPFYNLKEMNVVEASPNQNHDTNIGKDFNSWDEFRYNNLPSMEGIATATYNEKIYLGGRYLSSNNTFVFDGFSWNNGPNFPEAIRNTNFVVYNNQLFKVGGTNSYGGTVSSVWRLSDDNQSWDAGIGNLPIGVTVPGLAVLGEDLYSIGGYSSGNKNYVQTFDGSSWADITATDGLPVNHSPSQGIVTYNGRIYITGVGGTGVYSYDGAGNSGSKWRAEPSLPAAMAKDTHVTKVYNGRIYTIGGTNVFSWRPGETEWRIEPNLPASRYRHGGAVLGEHLYIIGGSPLGNQVNTSNTVYRYPGSTISLNEGSLQGGDELIITGIDLTNGESNDIQSVTLGGIPAEIKEVTTNGIVGKGSISTIKVETGEALAAGKVDLVIKTARGEIVRHNAFEYLEEVLSSDVTISSDEYIVEDVGNTISSVPGETQVLDFIGNINAHKKATLAVYESDGTTVRVGDIQTGDKLIVTAEDGITTRTYTITVTKTQTPDPGSDGSEQEPPINLNSYEIIRANEPWGATIEGSSLYFVEMNTKNIVKVSLSDNTRKVIQTGIDRNTSPLTGIAITGDDVYISSFNTLYKGKLSELENGNSSSLVEIKKFQNPTPTDLIEITGLTIDSQKEVLYFADQHLGKIYTIPLNQLDSVDSEILENPWFDINPNSPKRYLRGITFHKGSIYGISWDYEFNSYFYKVPINADGTAGSVSNIGNLPVQISGPNSFLAGGPAIDKNGKVYITDMTSKFAMITPPAPQVTANDETNVIVHADNTMEYSEDNGLTWTNYNFATEPTFPGEKTVLVRVKEVDGVSYASPATTLNFTANPPSYNGPTIANNAIEATIISTSGVSLNWNKAMDDVTVQEDLEYQVYQSMSNNIDTISNIEDGTPLGNGFKKDLTMFDVTGLLPNTTYYFNVLVKDVAGNKSVYTMKEVKTTSANNADLSNLTLSSGVLSPSFAAGTGHYTVNVGNDVTSIRVTPTVADANATVMVNGSSALLPIYLNVGDNTITIIVTAEDGISKKTYTVTVTRANPHAPNDSSESDSTPSSNTEQIVVDVDGNNGSNLTKTPITRTTGTDGKVKDHVSMSDTIAKDTVEKAKQQGVDTARIVIPDTNDKVSEVTVEIPRSALKQLNDGKMKLEIATDNAIIAIPTESISTFNDDLYFRVVPLKTKEQQKQVEERAKKEEMIQEIAKNQNVQVLGRPMEIETNMQSREVSIILPLKDSLPTDAKEREKVLDNLAIFIEHSDGSKEVLQGKVVSYKNNGELGLEFKVNKFSTFTIVYMDGAQSFFDGKATCGKDTISVDAIGCVSAKKLVPVYELVNNRLKKADTLNAGLSVPAYEAISPMLGLGGDIWVERTNAIRYETPSKAMLAKNSGSKRVKQMWKGLELRPGQIGKVTVIQDTVVWEKINKTKKLPRILKKGEQYRVYRYVPGMYNLGNGKYVVQDDYVMFKSLN